MGDVRVGTKFLRELQGQLESRDRELCASIFGSDQAYWTYVGHQRAQIADLVETIVRLVEENE